MRLKDVSVLATAKLRVRKRRTIITSLTISLLFGVVIALLVVSGSLLQSLKTFNSELFSGDTFLHASTKLDSPDNPDTLLHAKKLYQKSKNLDKRSPIDPATKQLDRTNPFAKKAIKDFQAKQTEQVKQHLAGLVEDYHGTLISATKQLTTRSDIISIDSLRGHRNSPGSQLTVVPDSVLGNIVQYKTPQSDVVPVVVYASYAGDILDLKPLAKGASPKERGSRLNYIYNNAPGTRFAGQIKDATSHDDHSINYQIIGVLPDDQQLSTGTNSSVNMFDILLSSLTNGSHDGMVIPTSLVGSSVLKNYQYTDTLPLGYADFIIRFKEVNDATDFAHTHDCSYVENNCDDLHVSEFITSRIALSDMADIINKVIVYIAVFFSLVAVFIMTGMLSQIISEEKQTTAIYRAVGASRMNIGTIYTLYVIIFSALSALFAVGVGYVIALALHLKYAGELTLGAKNLYGVASTTHGIALIGLDLRVLLIVAVMLAIGLIVVLLSLNKMIAKSIVRDVKGE